MADAAGEVTPECMDALEAFIFELRQGEPWMKKAACRGYVKPAGPNPFFPDVGESTAKAYEMCNSCSVVEECRTYRERTGSCGIWAGEYYSRVTTPVRDLQDARPRKIAAASRRRKSSPVTPKPMAARKKI